MIIEIMIFTLLGIAGGVVAGLLPGIHPNTLIALLLGIAPLLAGYPVHALVAMVVSMVVTNTLVSYIPSIFLGAPEDATALSVLPGHRLLMEGRGLEAIYLTVIGGVGVVLLFASLLPLFVMVLPVMYAYVKTYIPFLLIGISAVMVLLERGFGKLWALVVLGLSGALGMITLNSYLVQPNMVFFPLFSGLFGTSTLLISLKSKTKLVAQVKSFGTVDKMLALNGIVKGMISGLIVGILPAVGSAQAATLVQTISRKRNDREFLVSIGGINTASALFALVALYVINKPRSGAAVAVDKLVGTFGFSELVLLTGVTLFTTGIAVVLTLYLSKKFLAFIERVPYDKLSISVIAFLVILALAFAGPFGLLILGVSTAIGMVPPLVRIKRSLLMGVLLIPTIFFYFGFV